MPQMEVEVRHIAFWDIHFLWVKKMLYVSYIKYSSHWKWKVKLSAPDMCIP